MGGSCFAPGCSTGYSSSRRRNQKMGIKNPSVFRPKDEAQLEQWKRAVPRKDKEMSLVNHICEAHFTADDILRFYETLMPDGTVNKIPRGKPSLREGAVPCIFPNWPPYLSKEQKRRKGPKERISTSCLSTRKEGVLKEDETDAVSVELDVGGGNNYSITQKPISDGCFSLKHLLKNVANVSLPNGSWGAAVVEGSAVFFSINNNYVIDKTVVVIDNLQTKVMINQREVAVSGMRTVESVGDMSAVLAHINGLELCVGVGEKRRDSVCLGYVEDRGKAKNGRHLSFRCLHCKSILKRMRDKEHRQLKRALQQKKITRSASRSIKSKTTRLVSKV